MTDELGSETTPEIEADEIDLDFVPQPRDSVVATEFDGELLLVDSETGFLNLLDPVGSIVWNCLDGQVTLSDLAEELADAFGAPVEVVRDDVLEMVRTVGRAGLLTGVARPRPAEPLMPTGLEVGEAVKTFSAPTLDGAVVDLADLRNRPALLVNWSPRCGYCAKIAPQLAEVQPALAEQGVPLLLLTVGDAEENRELLQTHGLAATVLLGEEASEEFEDPFPEMGTPVAYLLDAEGRVAEPLAYGSLEVPALARRVAGMAEPEPAPVDDDRQDKDHDHDHDHAKDDHDHQAAEGGPRYLPVSGVCNPGSGLSKNKAREWARTSAYEVGEFHIGIRADSVATDELLGRLFAAHRLPADVEAPENYSVVLGEGAKGGTRGLNLLLRANTTVVRSRSPRRVLLALANYLSSLVEPEDGLLRTSSVGAVIGDSAILLPSVVVQWLEQAQPRLTRMGVRLVDRPYTMIDLERLELVVPDPLIQLDQVALAAVQEPPPGRSELPAIEAGRYPLRAWTLPEAEEGNGRLTRAQAVATSLPSVVSNDIELDEILLQLGRLLERISPVPLSFSTAEELTQSLKERLPALR